MSCLLASVLMCHAPIVIPEIAGSERDTICISTQSMQTLADLAVSKNPEVIVLISPHAPRYRDVFGISKNSNLFGDFGNFGHREISFLYENDLGSVERVLEETKKSDFPLKASKSGELDHGAMVPLYFLRKAGWEGLLLLISFPYNPPLADCVRLGEQLTNVFSALKKKWVLVASGDMSHRLIPGAPGGFHEDAHKFDRYIEKNISQGNYSEVLKVDHKLRDLAAEDVVDSLCVAFGAVNFNNLGHKKISYEGPFGVGYLNAVLYDPGGK